MDMQEPASETTGSISQSLLASLRTGDYLAWHRMAYLFGPLVYRWCLKANLQAADAEDVVQEVFVKVASGIGTFRREKPGDTFRGWLWRITQHKLIDHFRRRASAPASLTDSEIAQRAVSANSLDDDGTLGEEGNDVGELYQRALETIGQEFAVATWQAFWKVAVAGRSPADVAAELGMTTNAVYIARSRVFRRLRDELGEE
jgi:RNA polymerase sigma-70 factor (ECF subfamily)